MLKGEKIRKRIFNRREFLAFGWVVSLTALFGQGGAALLRFFRPRIKPGTFGGKVIAGQVAEFEPGTVSHVQEGRFFISRLEDGGILALWHQCPHLGCVVPWQEGERRFHCPCHSSIFNIQGEVLSGPAPRPLDMFPIEITDGQISVDTSRSIARDHHDSSHVTYT